MRLPAKLALMSVVAGASIGASVTDPAVSREPGVTAESWAAITPIGRQGQLSGPQAKAFDPTFVGSAGSAGHRGGSLGLSATLADLVWLNRTGPAGAVTLVTDPAVDAVDPAGVTPVWGDVTGRVHVVNARFRVF